MNPNYYSVIMAGGIGSRFWPMSRNAKPKQFLDILGNGRTLLQQSYDRLTRVCLKENILIVTNEAYVDLVKEQLPGMDPSQILSEPYRKNTAPCIAYAAHKIQAINPNAAMLVAPSDHVIKDQDSFVRSVNKGLEFVMHNDSLLTIGIKPSRPDTGYGYIQMVTDNSSEEFKITKVKTFTEKPNLEMAKFFLQSGEFAWNAGIFMWSVKSILKAMEEFLPEMNHQFAEHQDKYNTPEEHQAIIKVYEHCPSISIDFAILEKAKNVYVMSADFGWSDLGTYGSLHEHLAHDKNQNSINGKHVMIYDSKNCYINVPKEKLVVIQGLDDYIVVDSGDVLLICRKQDEQQIRQFVNDVQVNKGDRFV